MYFHTDEPSFLIWFEAVVSRAATEGRKLRLDTDEQGNLRIKLGEGVWSPPFQSTPDPYRS